MADLKIYNNGENKILFSAGDRIIRQPYEFGNVFQNRVGLNNYIKIPPVNLPNTFHLSYYVNRKDIVGTPDIIPVTFTDGTLTLYNYIALNSTSTFFNSLRSTLTQNLYINHNSPRTQIVLAHLSYARSNTLKYIGSNTSYTTNSIISSTILGSNITFNLQSAINYKTASFKVFNRNLSLVEIKYYYNNGLFSELQNTEGLEIDLPCNFAEILDFSALQDGSDMRVGCRDYSGFNRHGEIMNLPEGTLQEQLDWANANLFVPFIS